MIHLKQTLAITHISTEVSQYDPFDSGLCQKLHLEHLEFFEAVQNAIIHAYPSFLGIIRIRARIYNGNILRIEVKDKGPGIPNVTEALKPAFTTANGRSGIGFTIMKSFMTTLNVHSTPGKGTTVTMEYHTGQSKETGDLA